MLAQVYRKTIAYGGMTFMGIITAAVRYISFGAGINLNRLIVAPTISKIMLFMVGVKVKSTIDHNLNNGRNVCYFFNHNSFLDIFMIPLLGLKNTRFIITEGVKNIIPLHLCNLGVDVLYIPDSHKTKERIEFFKRVTQDLKDGKYSVICSPEGRHTFIHGISKFNNGVFHMATEAKTPIHTLFFDIPRDANPLESTKMSPCMAKISSQEIIETKNWALDDLEQNKQTTRNKFLEYYKNTYGDYGVSSV